MKFECFIDYAPWSMQLRIFIIAEDSQGRRSLCQPMEMNFEPLKDGAIIERGSLELNRHFSEPFLQAMANMLNEHGIRPEGKPVLENELTAMKYHLEDMRRLVFRVKK